MLHLPNHVHKRLKGSISDFWRGHWAILRSFSKKFLKVSKIVSQTLLGPHNGDSLIWTPFMDGEVSDKRFIGNLAGFSSEESW